MARATRSTANIEQTLQKKRKRNSSPHEKPHKLIRTEPPSASVADSTLAPDDARKILDVLETSDSLGLLDRVFPLAQGSDSYSLRTLLSQPLQHSFRVLRTAVQHLHPISSLPRSKPSATATQQLRFCNLALSLLDQASRNALSVPLDVTSLFPTDPTDISPDDVKHSPSPPSPSLTKRRYALVQHLPSGDYWSSLSNDRLSSPPTQLKDLPTGHAELVSILPSSSSCQSSKPVPTLGSYSVAKPHAKKALPVQRRLTAGAFLDYGPWASFAPSFDHDCELVGRRELGEVLWYRREKKMQRESELREWMEGRGSIIEVQPEEAREEDSGEAKDKVQSSSFDVETEFDGILPPEDIQHLKAALDNAELEKLVDELLARTQRALLRLQELQIDRLTKPGAGSTTIDESSEEWAIAHGIMESLATLTTLRPRAANGEVVSIVPPPSVLRKLHKTLALEPSSGWYGTLPPTRATALRDDSTVKVRATSALPVPAPSSTSSSPAPTPMATATVATPTTTPYTGYAYAYPTQQQGQVSYRPAGTTAVAATAYTPYKPGATSYYQQQYYGQQAYGSGATGQQPYAAYSNWFAHAQQYMPAASIAPANAASTTGRGTPQPGSSTNPAAATAAAAAAMAASYGSFFTPQNLMAQQQRTGTPAVANTAAMNKVGTGASASGTIGATAGNWVGYGQQLTNGYQAQQQSYYGSYPMQQQRPQQQQTQQPAPR